MSRTLWITLAVLAVFGWREWSQREITHAPGILAPQQPLQAAIDSARPVLRDDFHLEPRARFELTARVLSRRSYRWGRDADLSPLDLALGWGPMSDQAVLDRLQITQGNRWYFWRYDAAPPIPPEDIVRHSANMHMIPAEPSIGNDLGRLRAGDVVRLEGFLVDARDAAGFTWRTSLSREDTGDGSCELFLVTAVQRAPRP